MVVRAGAAQDDGKHDSPRHCLELLQHLHSDKPGYGNFFFQQRCRDIGTAPCCPTSQFPAAWLHAPPAWMVCSSPWSTSRIRSASRSLGCQQFVYRCDIGSWQSRHRRGVDWLGASSGVLVHSDDDAGDRARSLTALTDSTSANTPPVSISSRRGQVNNTMSLNRSGQNP